MTGMQNKQAKVSIVMPCYNKVDSISEMLDSIIAQKWDNIELIMVNDGSTDGTREIIGNYVSRLRERGFDVIVIDQENAGVCAAGKNGLSRITGDYVCQVDCDDELDPEYISIPVLFLETHPNYDYTACHLIKYQGSGKNKEFLERELRPIPDDCQFICEMYLTERVVMPVWVYMVRASYLRKCGLPESYYTDTKGSHEPGYVIPLTANNGKVKYFPLPLYRFNFNGEGHSRFIRFEQAVKFYEEYLRLMLISVERLGESVPSDRKERLVRLCHLHHYFNLYIYADKLAKKDDGVYQSIADELNSFLVESNQRKRKIPVQQLRSDWFNIITILQNEITAPNEHIMSEKRNVIIWGQGVIGREFYRRYFEELTFAAFVDNNPRKHGQRFWGLDILPPSMITEYENAVVVVCVREHFEVAQALHKMGIKTFWLNPFEYPLEARYMNFDGFTLMDFSNYKSLEYNPRRVWLKEHSGIGGSCYAIWKFVKPKDIELILTQRDGFNLKNEDDYYMCNTCSLVITQTIEYVGGKRRAELWHGFPIKALWNKTNDEQSKKYFVDVVKKDLEECCCFYSYSKLFNHFFDCCTDSICIQKYAVTGMPRNDLLLKTNGRDLLERLFPICRGKKTIVYAPTFRASDAYGYNSLENGVFFVWKDYSFAQLEQFLRKHGIVLLIKMHYIELNQYNICESEYIKIIDEPLLRANDIRFYELLSGTDALISDYSSIWVDYLLLDKPIIFAALDLEEYQSLHGLMVEPFEIWAPGEIVVSIEQLQAAILNALFETDGFAEKRLMLTQMYHKYTDGNSSERVVNIIREILEKDNKPN